MATLKMGVAKATNGNEENRKRIREREVAKAQTEFIIKGVGEDHSMDDMMDHFITIRELYLECVERTARLGTSAEMRERIKERKQKPIRPIRVSMRSKDDVSTMFSRLGYLQGSAFERLKISVCVPRSLWKRKGALRRKGMKRERQPSLPAKKYQQTFGGEERT